MKWSSVDWTATEAVVGRIQDRIFRAAKIKRPRLEPDDEQSSCPVLRGLGSGNGARLPDYVYGRRRPDPSRRRPGSIRIATTKVAVAQWEVCLQAAHPGYIGWEEFMANQKRLADNVTATKRAIPAWRARAARCSRASRCADAAAAA